MKPTQTLHDLGQSLWLEHITRDLLDQVFAHALASSRACDAATRAFVESWDGLVAGMAAKTAAVAKAG